MEIEWLSKKKSDGMVSIYRNNLTFNMVSSAYLNDAFRLRIGVEGEHIVIEPLDKERVFRGDIDENTIYELKRKRSYSRLADTNLVNAIAEHFNLDLSIEPLKRKTHWDEARKVLVIELEGN